MNVTAGSARISDGFNPDPGKPTIVAPPNACDCHAHIIGPVGQYPFAEGRSYTPPEAPREAYQRMLTALGLQRAVIVQPSFYGTDNRCTYDAIVQSGGAWRAVAVLNPDTPTKEMQRLHDAGFRAARINLIYKGGVTVDTLEPLAKLIAPFNWHLELLTDGRDLVELAPRLRRLPVRVEIDHIGRVPANLGASNPGFQALLGLLREGNCWVKLSGGYLTSSGAFPYEDVAPMAKALVEAAPERLVWGSDWPHQSCKTAVPKDAGLLDLLGIWAPDLKVRNRILADNAAALYDFPS